MFKKLLTLAAVATLGLAANAETVVDYEIDWGTKDSWNRYAMGYVPTIKDGALYGEWPCWDYASVSEKGEGYDYPIVKVNGEDMYEWPTEDGGPRDTWGIQYHVIDKDVATEAGTMYKVTIVGKANKEVSISLPFSWGWGSGEGVNGSVTLGTEYEELELEYPEEVGGASCWMVLQFFDKEAQIWIKSVKVTHEAKEQKPAEWINLLTNGDAEQPVNEEAPDMYSKHFLGDRSIPEEIYPTPIETVDGGRVYVTHATAVDKELFNNGDNTYDGAFAWMNQMWIQAPQSFNAGDIFKVSFRYKASKPSVTNTQAHGQTPGSYLHWEMIGDVSFTTDWQNFEKQVTVNGSQNGMWSIAFNLSPNQQEATDYYLDDIKWEIMKLDDGYFVAWDDMDLGDAVEFVYDNDDEVFKAVAGTENDLAESIKISTKRGNDTAFNSNLLKIDGEVMDGETVNIVSGQGKKISLPEPGIWAIELDEEYQQITFYNETDGVEGISVDNAPAVYYNLQGVQVANPANGQIYIVKRGNKVTKEIR